MMKKNILALLLISYFLMTPTLNGWGARPEKPDNVEYYTIPNIYFIQLNNSVFINDGKPEQGKLVKIIVDNPQNCHIIHASIKLNIPEGWNLNPDTSSDIINYDPDKSTFWVDDWGDFNQSNAESWFETAPDPQTLTGKYKIRADVSIKFKNKNSSIEHSKKFSEFMNITVIDDLPKTSTLQILQINTWVFALISATCALVGIYITISRKNKEPNKKDVKHLETKDKT